MRALSSLARYSTEFGKRQLGTQRVAQLNVLKLRQDMEAAVIHELARQTLASLGTQALTALGWTSARAAWIAQA